MFYDSELRFLQKMLDKCHLQNLIINPENVLDERIDSGLRKLFNINDFEETFYDFFPTIKANTVYRVTDIFLCRYIFFALPFYNDNEVFVIGPYLNTELSEQQILEQREKLGVSPSQLKGLEMFYASLPVIREENHIFAMVNTFAEFLWNGSENFENTDITRDSSAAFISNIHEFKSDSNNDILNMQVMENRYSYENQLIEAVSQGNIQKAEHLMAGFSSNAFEKRAADQLRNIKNYCIIMNTLLRKAAEKGGVHPIYLDRVSSDFAKKIESLQAISIAQDFMINILRTYCRLVRTHSIKNYSPLVQKAVVKIENDLTDDLSLNTMALINNVSPGYFSSLFKKETGKTLTEYVNDKRISYAKHLLKSTNLQVQTIAQYCGILDTHYFCRIFKKATDKTPLEYRESRSF